MSTGQFTASRYCSRPTQDTTIIYQSLLHTPQTNITIKTIACSIYHVLRQHHHLFKNSNESPQGNSVSTALSPVDCLKILWDFLFYPLYRPWTSAPHYNHHGSFSSALHEPRVRHKRGRSNRFGVEEVLLCLSDAQHER